ncbi:MAG TPA: hypothetical protein VM487_17420, partial [Phycisphaerae bacterium]|nr:hypothetical protein [Phycisphaerae bacterium]
MTRAARHTMIRAARQMTGLSFTAPVQIDLAAAADGEKRLPTFDIVAYTGGEMRIWGWGRIVIDLAGMKVARQVRPVLRDHDPTRPVGHTTAITVGQGQVAAKGALSFDNDLGREIVTAAKNGFQWEASCGWSVGSYEEVKAGNKVT